jgi:hypothetical protein
MDTTSHSGPSLSDSVKIDDQVVFRELEGEMVLLNLETGIYFGLDPIGTRIWTLLREHESLQQVFEVLLQEYDVPEAVLKADLLRLAREFSSHGLARVRREGGDSTAD